MATFKELTGIDPVADVEEQRPLETIHQSGSDTRRAEAEAQIELDENTSTSDMFGAAWERNIGNTLYDAVQRKWTHRPEEGFDPTKWVDENKDSLPGVNLEAFSTVRSTAEANELREDMVRADDNDKLLAAKGYSGVAAQMLTGIVDPAEIVIGIASGGTSKAATLGRAALKGARVGAIGGLAAGGVNTLVDPLADSKQIVYGALTGALLGGAFGSVAHKFSTLTKQTRDNYSTEVDDLPRADAEHSDAPVFGTREPRTFDPDNLYDAQTTNMSVGAASFINGVDVSGMNPSALAIFQDALSFNRANQLATRLDDVDFSDSASGRTAKRFSDALAMQAHRGLQTDFDRLAYGGSTIEQNLAYNLMESPEGRVRNNRSAAMLQETYESRLSSHSLPQLDEGFDAWAKQRQLGVIDKHKPGAREEFDRAVIEELEARFHEGKPVSGDPIIKGAADAVDNNYADAVSIGKGRKGETSVSGFEDINPQSGFFNHKWNGKAMRRLLARGVTREQLEEVLDDGLTKTYPDMEAASRTIISKAVIRRALAREDGIDTNMLNSLDADGEEYLRELLTDSGYDKSIADRLIDSIKGRKEEASKLGTTKKRVQLDLRTSNGDFSLLDMVDTNLTRVLSQYNRTVSGNAALARKGIQNRAQRKEIIEAAMTERRARGLSAEEADRRYLEDIFTHFDAGPIGGGIDPTVGRAKRLTNLALLNQMGLTQAGETGAQIAAVGMETWQRHATKLYKTMKDQGPDGHIVRELRPMMGQIGKEHLLFRDDLMLDELASTKDLNSFLGKLDFALGKGQRIQGYASGFYAVRSMQQRIAVSSMADKAMQRLRDGVDADALADIGVPQSLKKYIDNGTVEFEADGFLDRLNLDRWEPQDAEDLALALNRHTHQVVQKAMAGESSMWMHKTVGSLFMHLKTFPLLAMRKQAIRTMSVGSPLALSTLMMGLATAGLASQVKQMVGGKFERLGPQEALEGAMAMSNMTGWVPMLTDPAAAMLGMNQLKLSQYGRHNLESGVISTPPALPTINKMLQSVGAVNPLSDLSKNERIRIMQATPLVGNLYGFSALFNAMKD